MAINRQPDFGNLLKVLRKEIPDRPTLFEFFLNPKLYDYLSGEKLNGRDYGLVWSVAIKAYHHAGYDYAPLRGSDFAFPAGGHDQKSTLSLNDATVIGSQADFEKYPWPVVDDFNYGILKDCESSLPDGMKIIVWGPGGVLENVIRLVGYDNLCFMVLDNPALAQQIFDAVGSRLVRHYQIAGQFSSVGAMISNDDWGFNTQTMLSPADMRKFVFPWHKKIAEAIHASGRPAILHSCGNMREVWDDIIDDMGYDAKHSYEDNIQPVEEAYDQLKGRIAVLGGIDLDFICRETPENVRKRCHAMVEKGMAGGGYALGTGNSVPKYVPWQNYFAMLSVCCADIK